ncbi:esterase/lipase superfamily enzyme [Rhodopirellula rubra]|uniref:Esterase/lipase superfamily enzyme n=1 Tax=Aporhodopirellula rubra TaxID=980271 RepID=A0A7W5DY65_9BACT|nr:alpha/beta fold hydrolase [Aporhodopirellula rubra]MBB3206701.1 esterase/lipase superfamily enzyme [Aporhodopirellula rubra]
MNWRNNHTWLAGIVIIVVAGCSRAPDQMAENSSPVQEIELPEEFSTPHQLPNAAPMTGPASQSVEPLVAEVEPSPITGTSPTPAMPPVGQAAPPARRPRASGSSASIWSQNATKSAVQESYSRSRGPYSPTPSKSSKAPSWKFSDKGASGSSFSGNSTPASGMVEMSSEEAMSFDQGTADENTADESIADEKAAASTAVENLALEQIDLDQPDAPLTSDSLPADSGAEDSESPFQSVDVLYATDRKQDTHPLSAYQLTGQRQLVSLLGMGVAATAVLAMLAWLLRRTTTAKLSGGLTLAFSIAAACVFFSGAATIEKHGVTYTGDRGTLVRGVCRVTVPKTHTPGTVERPSLLKFEVSEDQSKHIVLTSVEELAGDAFSQRLHAEIQSASQPDLLVFIHGYNVGFESAVLRTAQIAVDLPFQGVPICYSWPSQGTLMGYPVDENNAAWTVGHLKEFLNELVDTSGAKSIHVVAHSMGNRAMTAAMQQMALTRQDAEPIFDRVVLAAPDVDADLFRKDLAGALTQVAEQVTLYASSDDQALVASKAVHGYPRAGETGEFLVVVPGVDTIDVSGIDLSLLGHSYYGDSEAILRDLYEMLLSRLPAYKRSSLVSRDYQSQVYWQLAHGGAIAAGVSR